MSGEQHSNDAKVFNFSKSVKQQRAVEMWIRIGFGVRIDDKGDDSERWISLRLLHTIDQKTLASQAGEAIVSRQVFRSSNGEAYSIKRRLPKNRGGLVSHHSPQSPRLFHH